MLYRNIYYIGMYITDDLLISTFVLLFASSPLRNCFKATLPIDRNRRIE